MADFLVTGMDVAYESTPTHCSKEREAQSQGQPLQRCSMNARKVVSVAGETVCTGMVVSHWNLGHFGWQEGSRNEEG
ncbi:hypothetical protein AZKH_0335 [Azoarcus sp. KH32C]|nr:hypothetical protein AZKH_0335 [Azoarcus sp. KH32C]